MGLIVLAARVFLGIILLLRWICQPLYWIVSQGKERLIQQFDRIFPALVVEGALRGLEETRRNDGVCPSCGMSDVTEGKVCTVCGVG